MNVPRSEKNSIISDWVTTYELLARGCGTPVTLVSRGRFDNAAFFWAWLFVWFLIPSSALCGRFTEVRKSNSVHRCFAIHAFQ